MTKLPLVAIVAFTAFAGSAVAQNADQGKIIFDKCAACHAIGPGAKNKFGPVLTGVIGRTAGSLGGYRYSKSMKAAGAAGLVWDKDRIFAYLQDPSKYLRAVLGDSKAKAKMRFKLRNEKDRRDVIAYLASFESSSLNPGSVCVTNGSEETHLFAAEARGGARETAMLAPGTSLCVAGTEGGVVSVFEQPDELEGCSKLVVGGKNETFLKYADFDRCAWSSNTG